MVRHTVTSVDSGEGRSRFGDGPLCVATPEDPCQIERRSCPSIYLKGRNTYSKAAIGSVALRTIGSVKSGKTAGIIGTLPETYRRARVNSIIAAWLFVTL